MSNSRMTPDEVHQTLHRHVAALGAAFTTLGVEPLVFLVELRAVANESINAHLVVDAANEVIREVNK